MNEVAYGCCVRATAGCWWSSEVCSGVHGKGGGAAFYAEVAHVGGVGWGGCGPWCPWICHCSLPLPFQTWNPGTSNAWITSSSCIYFFCLTMLPCGKAIISFFLFIYSFLVCVCLCHAGHDCIWVLLHEDMYCWFFNFFFYFLLVYLSLCYLVAVSCCSMVFICRVCPLLLHSQVARDALHVLYFALILTFILWHCWICHSSWFHFGEGSWVQAVSFGLYVLSEINSFFSFSVFFFYKVSL